MPCHGNTVDHCCWLVGKPCIYLEENTVSDRHWVCGLRRRLGNWDAVLMSNEYKTNVAPKLNTGINCRDWPDKPLTKCFECGFAVEPTDHGYKWGNDNDN